MARKYQLEELDDFTQDYLRAARDRRGEGMPGIFAPRTNYLPIIGVSVGGILILVILICTLGSTDDPFKTALLQTAGLLLGGWMIVAAVRVWMARGSRGYLGHFVYADALNVYDVSGSTVTVIDILGLQSANGVDNFNDGNYQNTLIELYLEKGQQSVTVNSQDDARRLLTFLNGLGFIRSQGTAELQSQTPAALSVTARRMADGERGRGSYRAHESESDFAALPVPQKVGRASSGLIAYSVIVALAVLGIIVLRAVNIPLRDDAIFELVMTSQPVRPPALRFYLLHPNNTRHRAAVERRLASMYEPVLARLRQQAQDPDLGPEFVKLASTLKTAVEPVISIRVKEELKDRAADLNDLGLFGKRTMATREQEVKKLLIDNLTHAISDGSRDVHNMNKEREDMVAFVQVPDDVKPLFEVVYQLVPEPKSPGMSRVEWTVGIREKPDSPQVKQTWMSERSFPDGTPSLALRDEVARTLAAVSGQPLIPPGPGWPGVNQPFKF